ncbi:hypothetical protein FDV58_40710 [Bradyrhizobium elkanii]|uniref:Uncharacterized protein n=1 Tax=Bradyrhizobium elkanii TaxID=29448 RepID=A0A4U6RAX3_BRAEL|nr:hypothetical protein FDV58_40710 [Bradyrhizobium elkanii]
MRSNMSHAAGDRYEMSTVTEEERELARCRQEIAHLKRLVVQLSQLVLRHVAENAEERKSQSR